MKHIIALLVENEAGALSRVVGLFSARGYNIESLTVATTEDPSLSVMFIVPMNAPGIKMFCRVSYEQTASAAAQPFDYPLSSRFDENDAILVLDNFGSVVQEVLPDTQVRQVITTGLGDMLGAKGLLVNFVLKYIKKMVPNYSLRGAIRFNQALKLGSRHTLPKVEIDHDDVAEHRIGAGFDAGGGHHGFFQQRVGVGLGVGRESGQHGQGQRGHLGGWRFHALPWRQN